MLRINIFLLAVLAICALSVAATSAASAHEFNNKGAESKIVGTADAVHVFTTAAGRAECTKFEVISGNAPAGKTASLLVIIQLSGCKAFGLSAKVSEASYLLDANGEVRIEKPIKITATACEVVIPEQTVKTLKYENNASKKSIKLIPEITGITSEGKGQACQYASESKGTFTGALLLSLENGAEIEYTSP